MLRLTARACLLLAAAVFAACSPPDRVEIEDRVERSKFEDPVTIGASSQERFGGPMTIGGGPQSSGAPAASPTTAAATGSGPLAFDTPEGWTQIASTDFRDPNFVIGPNGEVECYVTILPMGAGLKANADRWAAQMSLQPLTDEDFSRLPRTLVLGREAVIMDVAGDFRGMGQGPVQSGYRLLGALVDAGNQAVFIKMTGPDAMVAAQRDQFARFVMSLQDVTGALGLPTEHPPIDAPTPGDPGMPQTGLALDFTWETPEGWVREDIASPMRVVTFHFGAQHEGECYVTVLGGTGGGRLANYNRWLGQLDEPPLEESELELQPKVTLLDQLVPMLIAQGDYSGMGGASVPNAVLYGASAEIDGRSIFVKLVAPQALGEENWDAFVQFCESFKLRQ